MATNRFRDMEMLPPLTKDELRQIGRRPCQYTYERPVKKEERIKFSAHYYRANDGVRLDRQSMSHFQNDLPSEHQKEALDDALEDLDRYIPKRMGLINRMDQGKILESEDEDDDERLDDWYSGMKQIGDEVQEEVIKMMYGRTDTPRAVSRNEQPQRALKKRSETPPDNTTPRKIGRPRKMNQQEDEDNPAKKAHKKDVPAIRQRSETPPEETTPRKVGRPRKMNQQEDEVNPAKKAHKKDVPAIRQRSETPPEETTPRKVGRPRKMKKKKDEVNPAKQAHKKYVPAIRQRSETPPEETTQRKVGRPRKMKKKKDEVKSTKKALKKEFPVMRQRSETPHEETTLTSRLRPRKVNEKEEDVYRWTSSRNCAILAKNNFRDTRKYW